MTFPWPPACATGVGSLPGTDIDEALRLVLGELPDLAHLPELPERGPGAQLVGRGAGFLVDMPVDIQPSGWRIVDRPGRDLRRTIDFLDRDLDTLSELAVEYEGVFKVQVTGPWTLASAIELHYGDKVLADHGAVRELATSLAEGVAAHVADVRKRVPRAALILQIDEPALPAALAAKVPTASGFGNLRAVKPEVAAAALAQVVSATDAPVVVHCCAADVPYEVFARAGAAAVSVDLSVLGLSKPANLDRLAAAIDGGLALWAGVVPGTDAGVGPQRPGAGDGPQRTGAGVLSDPAGTVSAVRALWRQIGFDADRLAESVVVTPACGLAGASPAYARAALARIREGARTLIERPD